MGESVEFTVKLDDKVSPAAKTAGTAVDRLGRSVKQLGGPTAKVRRGLTGVNATMGQSGAAATTASGGFGAMVGRMVPIAAVAAVAMRALSALARAAMAAGKAIAGAALYMSDMRYSLSKFLGSSAAGKREMAALLDISDELGVSFKDAAQTFKSFVSAGMTSDAAKEMVKLRADLTAVATTEKDLERVGEAFMQIEKAIATGRLEMDGFTSILAGLPGVTEDTIFAKLAPMMGKTVEELKKMQKTELPVPMLLKAIKAAFLEATGSSDLGALAMEKQLETVGGAFEAFKNVAGNALLRLGDEIAPMLKEELLPVLKDVMAAMKSEDGKAAIKGLAKAIGALIKLTVAFAKGMSKGFQAMLPGIKGIVAAIGKMLGSSDQMSTWETIFTGLGYAIGIVAGVIAGFVATIGLVVAAFGAVAGAIGSVISWFQQLPGTISNLASQFLAGGSSLGSAIIMGIIQGLTLGMAGVIISIVDVATKAIAAAKGALGVQSPSKVFAGIGANVAAGMEQGIAGGAPAVSSAAAGMIDPKRMAAAGGTTQHINAPAKIGITIQDSGDPQATAAAVAATLEAKVAGMFEMATLQVGVVGSG